MMPSLGATLVLAAATTATIISGAGLAGAQTLPGAVAVASVRDAECDRAVRCGQIGPGRLYPSLGACKEAVAKRVARDLSAQTCSGGVDFVPLAECVGDLRRLDCDALRAGASVPTCGKVALCGLGASGAVGGAEGALLRAHDDQNGH